MHYWVTVMIRGRGIPTEIYNRIDTNIKIQMMMMMQRRKVIPTNVYITIEHKWKIFEGWWWCSGGRNANRNILSSPKGPRAESARAVTSRRCPHSGTGQDFLARNGPNRTKTGVTRQRSERFGRAQRLNGANAEGYKRPVDKNRGPISKNGFSGRNPEFLAPQKKYTFQF